MTTRAEVRVIQLFEEQAWAKERMQPVEAGKGQETDSALESSERKATHCWHFDFSPERPF